MLIGALSRPSWLGQSEAPSSASVSQGLLLCGGQSHEPEFDSRQGCSRGLPFARGQTNKQAVLSIKGVPLLGDHPSLTLSLPRSLSVLAQFLVDLYTAPISSTGHTYTRKY